MGSRHQLAAALSLLLFAAPPAGAYGYRLPRPTFYLGGSFGMHVVGDHAAYVGDGGAIFDGLGGATSGPHRLRLQLDLRQAVPLLDWLAVDIRQTLWWDGMAARFREAPDLDSAIDRHVIGLAAGVQFTAGRAANSLRPSIAPALLVVVTDKSGWLGDGVTADASAGGVVSVGWWSRVTPAFALSVESATWLTHIPRASRVLDDGGFAVGFTLALDAYWSP